MAHSRDIGRIGEFLTSYILETYGVEVHHVDRAGADLWCKANNTLFTLQVKAASHPRPTRKNSSVPYYNYLTKNPNADYFAFVALDKQLILLRRKETITTEAVRIPPVEFNEANQRRTVEAMIADRGPGAEGQS